MFLKWIYCFDLQFHSTGRWEEFQLSFHPAGLLSAAQYIVSDEQPSNALSSIEVTLLGMLMLVSFEQPLNALVPIEVTLLGITMLVSDEQPENALPPIEVTPLAMSTLVSDVQR